jgi:2-polyprenyl-3-methyl-5-hydroxy-6-metoxy-1,4-benzoquinol methylase
VSTRTFDRTRDVAKLVGCNTRNVEYRWSIFDKHLQRIPRGSAVLDYGAGSLRESYELIRMGFNVTAIDNNAETLQSYYADYEWPRDPEIIVGTDPRALKGRKFALVTAFDVFEHLDEPEMLLAQLRELMADGALIFCTVPNRRSVFELAWRVNWKMGLALGRTFPPGEPHIQFKSPEEWRSFFERCGFRILDHEMAIGFFVNTWAALVDVPAGVLRKARRAIGLGADAAPSALLAGPRVMAALDAVDRRTRLHALYGWNLFVLAAGRA